jgi:hypothetical protein
MLILIKTLVKRRDGRQDIEALRERYGSDAASQTVINKAKSDLSNLMYKNETSFSFEKFSAKLQQAYVDLDDQDRPVNNGDIVDNLWPMIHVPALGQYIVALKMRYQQTPREYKLILQDIASEAGSQAKTVTFVPGSHSISAIYTRQGRAPTTGVYTAEGSIFIGSYDKDKWHSDSVKQYHQEIINERCPNDGGGKNQDSCNQKWKTNTIKHNKIKLKKLKAKIVLARTQLQRDSNNNSD